MRILKKLGFVVLFLCIFSTPLLYSSSYAHTFNGLQMESNIQTSDLQTQKKKEILDILEKENLILTEIKALRKDKQEDVVCLALNMYHENRGSSLEDRIASTYVVYNRQYDKPSKSLCDVIFEKWQFCWTNNTKIPVPKELQVWNKIQQDAYKMYLNPKFKNLAKEFRLKHYVASYMIPMKNKPKWIDKKLFKIDIGKHSYISLNKEDMKYKGSMIKIVQQGKHLLENKIYIKKR